MVGRPDPPTSGRGAHGRRPDAAMRRIAFMNEKGGTCKTTLCVNLGSWLARRRGRGSSSPISTPRVTPAKSLGLDVRAITPTVKELLLGTAPLEAVLRMPPRCRGSTCCRPTRSSPPSRSRWPPTATGPRSCGPPWMPSRRPLGPRAPRRTALGLARDRERAACRDRGGPPGGAHLPGARRLCRDHGEPGAPPARAGRGSAGHPHRTRALPQDPARRRDPGQAHARFPTRWRGPCSAGPSRWTRRRATASPSSSMRPSSPAAHASRRAGDELLRPWRTVEAPQRQGARGRQASASSSRRAASRAHPSAGLPPSSAASRDRFDHALHRHAHPLVDPALEGDHRLLRGSATISFARSLVLAAS